MVLQARQFKHPNPRRLLDYRKSRRSRVLFVMARYWLRQRERIDSARFLLILVRVTVTLYLRTDHERGIL